MQTLEVGLMPLGQVPKPRIMFNACKLFEVGFKIFMFGFILQLALRYQFNIIFGPIVICFVELVACDSSF